MLYDIREFVKTRVLKLIFHAIFNCQLNYANTVWGQNKNSLNCLILLQKKALRIISFECRNANLNLLFSIGMKLLNYMTKSSLKIVFLSVNILLLIFHQFSIFGLPFPRNLSYETSCSFKGFLKVDIVNAKKYHRETFINSARYHLGMIFKNIFHLLMKYYVMFLI